MTSAVFRLPALSELQLCLVREEMQTVSHLLRELYEDRVVKKRRRHPWERWLGVHPGRVAPDTVGFLTGSILPPWLGHSSGIGSSFARNVEAMLDDPAVPDHVQQLFDRVPAVWQVPFTQPRRWAGRLAEELRQARRIMQPAWELADLAMAAEEQRIDKANQHPVSKRQLLTRLWRGARVDGPDDAATLTIPLASHDMPVQGTTDKTLALAPMISSTPIVRYSTDGKGVFGPDPLIHTLSYPIPNAAAIVAGSQRPPPTTTDQLAALLGPVRAAVLRLLAKPRAMSDLAEKVIISPATAAYHCAQLEQAGLIERHRLGNRVWVRRTPRGDTIVDVVS